MSILIGCRECGTTTTSAESRDQVCLTCVVRKATRSDLERLAALLAKRRRYLNRNAGFNEQPVQDVVNRICRKGYAVLGAPAEPILKKLLDEVDAAAPKAPEPKILKVRTKDLLVTARG